MNLMVFYSCCALCSGAEMFIFKWRFICSSCRSCLKETLHNRTVGRFRTAEWRKNCRARPGMHSLAGQFFVILPSWVFQLSCCVRSLKKWRRQRQQINYLIGSRRKNNRAARAARFWCNFSTKSAKRRREIFIFVALTTTRARSSKSFILCLYMKAICAKQAKVHFAYLVQRDQHGIIAKQLTLRKVLFYYKV